MTLCDAGPLIALFNRKDDDHQRCVQVLPNLSPPLITTWPCFAEAMHLLGRRVGWPAQKVLWEFLEDGILKIHPLNELQTHQAYRLMARYKNVPMDLGDASLVIAATDLGRQLVFTLDSDFFVYRLPNKQAFEVIPGPKP